MSTVFNDITADSITTEELNSGDLIVRGAARFVNPIYAKIQDAVSIHDA